MKAEVQAEEKVGQQGELPALLQRQTLLKCRCLFVDELADCINCCVQAAVNGTAGPAVHLSRGGQQQRRERRKTWEGLQIKAVRERSS